MWALVPLILYTMTNRDDLGILPPSRWIPATAANATVAVETAPLAEPAAAMASI